MTEEEIREFSPDRLNYQHVADQIMQALSQSEQAAYLVYLKLSNKFGAAQKL